MTALDTETMRQAAVLWAYMSSFASDESAGYEGAGYKAAGYERTDAVVVCCSYDLRVCDHASQLLLDGVSQTLVLSGLTGNWTRHIWSQAEALVFRERALSNGVPDSKIVLEDRATNFGENVRFSKALLSDAESVIFVSKPSAMLRLMLTVTAQWPDVRAFVTCPQIRFPEEVSSIVGVLGVIDEMVGDIERVQKYPDLGYQKPHELPAPVLAAYEHLVNAGFVHHLTSGAE